MIRFDNSNLKVLNIFNNIFDSGRKLFELRRFFINLQNLIKVLYLLNAGIWWITYYWLLPIWYPHLFLHDLFLRLLRWINFLIAIIEPFLFWFSNNKLSRIHIAWNWCRNWWNGIRNHHTSKPTRTCMPIIRLFTRTRQTSIWLSNEKWSHYWLEGT